MRIGYLAPNKKNLIKQGIKQQHGEEISCIPTKLKVLSKWDPFYYIKLELQNLQMKCKAKVTCLQTFWETMYLKVGIINFLCPRLMCSFLLETFFNSFFFSFCKISKKQPIKICTFFVVFTICWKDFKSKCSHFESGPVSW